MTWDRYDKILQTGLEVVMRDCAIGTKKKELIKNHTLNNEVKSSPTIELSTQDVDQLETLLAERNKLLNEGLDLIANKRLTIYAYCQTLLINKEHVSNDVVESVSTSQLPDPHEIAKEFKKNDKSRNDTYSVDDIAFVMEYARKNPDVYIYADIIRSFQADPNCPEVLKKIKSDTAINWIKTYDIAASIKRK